MIEPDPLARPARVVEVDLRRVRMALLHPHVAAHGREDDREVVLARIELEGGGHGWGECSALARPGYTDEHLDGTWRVLRDDLAPSLVAGRPVSGSGRPMAEAALLDAVLDAVARRDGLSLVEALGAVPRRIDGTTVVAVDRSVDAVVAAVAATSGPVKLKVRPGWDLQPVGEVRRAFPDRLVAVDANGSYEDDGIDAGLGRLLRLDALGLWYVEQPMRTMPALAACVDRLHARICLDESVGSLPDADRALVHGAIEVLNVKPARVGGIVLAAELAAWASENGIDVFVGGMLETGVGRAGALAVAQLPACTLPTDLGPSSRYWLDDVTEPIEADADGRMVGPTGSGLGVEPRPDRLDATTVDRVVVR